MLHIAKALATQYISGKAVTPSKRELTEFCQWVDRRFERIARYVEFTEEEVSPERMQGHWEDCAILLVSTAHGSHPYWEPATNARFRAVHDWDHIHSSCGFDFAGETCVAGYAMATAPESIRWIIWSEVALQAAACIVTGKFQPQKLVK